MNNPLSGLGDMAKLQQQAAAMQKALQAETVTVDHNGVVIVMRGDQQIISIEIDGVMENRVAQAINDAVRQTQQLAARKLMDLNR